MAYFYCVFKKTNGDSSLCCGCFHEVICVEVFVKFGYRLKSIPYETVPQVVSKVLTSSFGTCNPRSVKRF